MAKQASRTIQGRNVNQRGLPPAKYYVPLQLRMSVLALLLAILLLLIGLTELACQRLPASNKERTGKSARRSLNFLPEDKEDTLSIELSSSKPPNPTSYINTFNRVIGPSLVTPFVTFSTQSTGSSTSSRTTLIIPSAPRPANYAATHERSIRISVRPTSTSTSILRVVTAAFSSEYHNPDTHALASPSSTVECVLTQGSTVPTDCNGTSQDTNVIRGSFPARDYFIGAFLPTIIAVVFSIVWVLLDSAAKAMEPFYQLASTDGATAKNSLCMRYTDTALILTPILALARGHATIMFTSLLQLTSFILPPLAAEVMIIKLEGTCNAKTSGEECLASLSVYLLAARVLEGVLAGMSVLLFFLMIAMYGRKSGVFSDPGSLAAVASLFNDLQLAELFREVDPRLREKGMAKQLEHYNHRYAFGFTQETDGSVSYGVVLKPAQGATHRPRPVGCASAPVKQKSPNSGHIRLCLVFVVFLAGLLAVITYYLANSAESGLETFMNSQAFGPRFLFAIFGMIIKKFWERLRGYLRKSEPYNNLTKGSSKARDSILLNPTASAFSTAFSSLLRGEIALLLVDMATLLCIPLIIALVNVPFSSGTLYLGFQVCIYFSIGVLSFMILVMFAAFFRLIRMRTREVPETLAGKMSLFTESSIPEKFRELDLAVCGGKERHRIIVARGEKYGLHNVVAIDGAVRGTIDEER